MQETTFNNCSITLINTHTRWNVLFTVQSRGSQTRNGWPGCSLAEKCLSGEGCGADHDKWTIDSWYEWIIVIADQEPLIRSLADINSIHVVYLLVSF